MNRSLRLLQVAIDAGPALPMLEGLALALASPAWEGVVEQRLVLKRDHAVVERLRERGVAVAELPFRRSFDFQSRSLLTEAVGIAHPDVILVWDRPALERLKAEGVPLLGVLSDYSSISRWRRCQHLLALSEDLAQAAVDQFWPASLVEAVPLFAVDEVSPPLPRAVLGLPEHGDLVVTPPLASGDPGAATLIEAAAPLSHVFLCLAAAEKDHRRLRGLLASSGMEKRGLVVYPEQMTPSLYALADLVVAAGQHDCIGTGVLSGWVAGKPVIGGGGMGPASLIRHGDNGLLCAPGDTAGLRQEIGRLLDDPLRFDRLAAAGRRSFEQHHSENRGVEAWVDALRRASGLPKTLDATDASVHTSMQA